jgi:hypothetical protein
MRRYRIVPAVALAAIMVVCAAGTAASKGDKQFKAEFRDPNNPEVVITPCVQSGKFSILPYRITKVSSKGKIKYVEVTFSPFTEGRTEAVTTSEGVFTATVHPSSVAASGRELKSTNAWIQIPIEAKAPAPGTYTWSAIADEKDKPPKPGKSKFTMLGSAPVVHVISGTPAFDTCPPGSTPIPGTDEPTGGASVAPTGPSKAFTRITIKHHSPFHGKVRSSNPVCKDGRRVILYRKSPKRIVGKDRTGRKGNWKVSGTRAAAGRFFAKVKGTTVGSVTCTPAKSRTLKVV